MVENKLYQPFERKRRLMDNINFDCKKTCLQCMCVFDTEILSRNSSVYPNMNNAQCNYSPKASFSNLSFMEADNINLTCQAWNLIIVKCVSHTEVYCLIVAASTRAWIVHYHTFFYEMKRRLMDNVNFTFRKIVCIKCASNTMYCPIIATSKYPIHGTQSVKPLYLLAQSYFLFLALLFFPSYNISWHPCILCICWVFLH